MEVLQASRSERGAKHLTLPALGEEGLCLPWEPWPWLWWSNFSHFHILPPHTGLQVHLASGLLDPWHIDQRFALSYSVLQINPYLDSPSTSRGLQDEPHLPFPSPSAISIYPLVLSKTADSCSQQNNQLIVVSNMFTLQEVWRFSVLFQWLKDACRLSVLSAPQPWCISSSVSC